MKAMLSNFHQSPRKVRLVANVIRGKSIATARNLLTFLPQKSSPVILKLLNSAVANARQTGADESALFVQAIAVNKGMVMRRFKPMARGRAAPFRRTMSIVTLSLGSKAAPKKQAAKKTAKKVAKKVPTKSE
jgi:large subunit ribosomal protein L22